MSGRYKVTLAYDGTAFHGSQRQPELRTVQGEVERALQEISWQGQAVHFAGRTDAGVHAAGQVIAFDFDWRHGVEDLQRALNATLPKDIAAVGIREAPPEFEPRFDASKRRYTYQIRCSPVRDPLQDRYRWRVWPEVDQERMNRAAQPLVGVHDFAALGSPHQKGGSTIREVFETSWSRDQEQANFEILGNAFLYHMVRRIVILLVEIGQGRKEISDVQRYLGLPQGPPARGLAPAHGLILSQVYYPAHVGSSTSP